MLAKFTKLQFDGLVLPGQTIRYEAKIGHVKEVGAQATVTGVVDGKQQAYAEIFFARLQKGSGANSAIPDRLFDPEDLCHWLHITGVFKVGVHADGSRMKPADYGLPVYE